MSTESHVFRPKIYIFFTFGETDKQMEYWIIDWIESTKILCLFSALVNRKWIFISQESVMSITSARSRSKVISRSKEPNYSCLYVNLIKFCHSNYAIPNTLINGLLTIINTCTWEISSFEQEWIQLGLRKLKTTKFHLLGRGKLDYKCQHRHKKHESQRLIQSTVVALLPISVNYYQKFV